MAATLWVSGGPAQSIGNIRSAKGASATGTDTAPTDDVQTEGLDLQDMEGFAVFVESDGGGNLTAGTLQCYIQNPANKKWYRCAELDLTVVGGAPKFAFAGFGVSAAAGRLVYAPVGLGVQCTVYINGCWKRR